MIQTAALHIHARLLGDPPLWSAEIHDPATREIVWSSWTDEWMAYQTLEEATQRANVIVTRLYQHVV